VRIALYEVSLDGHRFSYIRAIGSEAVRRGWKPTLVLPSTVRSHPAIGALSDCVGPQNILFGDYATPELKSISPLGLLMHHLRNHQVASGALQSFLPRCDFVYFPTLDYLDQAILLRGSPSGTVPMGGMSMRVRFHMRAAGIDSRVTRAASVAGALAFRRLLKLPSVRCVTTADPTLGEYSRGRGTKDFRKVRYVPELGMVVPAMDVTEARTYLGLEKRQHVVLVYGAISVRKGIPELLSAVARLGDLPLCVLIVGQADDKAREFLETPYVMKMVNAGRVKLRMSYSGDLDEAAAFAAADAVWVAYRNHSTMSGVFLQAVCAHRPVITADYGILPWLAARDGVGISVDATDPDSTAGRIADLFSDHGKYDTYRENTVRIAARHLPSSFGSSVCDAIASSLN